MQIAHFINIIFIPEKDYTLCENLKKNIILILRKKKLKIIETVI